MERTCIFVISDCLPFSRQIDFYISCYWKLSGLDCQACLALASAAKPVSGLYDLALGRTFKAFNSQVISMIQYGFCPNHLCCFLSFSMPPLTRSLSFPLFSSLIPKSFFTRCKCEPQRLKGLSLVPTRFISRKGGLVASRRVDNQTEDTHTHTHQNPPADI